ncbi:MAG TPA: hypothetical protein VFE62_04265 [Gemmataceae bacterium]|nr:hypothetical protein [Gemmataceae bacterium]
MTKAAEILTQAEQLAGSVQSWADLSNGLYDPQSGLLTRSYPTRAEREEFAKTPEYERIQHLLEEARDRFGMVAGATPKTRGKLVVSVPISLQGALEREAYAEGVSVDQLVVAKLAAQMKDLAGAT